MRTDRRPLAAAIAALGTLAIVVLAIGAGVRAASAQAAPPPRERVHPELVDTTWGRRTTAAWQRAFARDWRPARDAFGALLREQPDALEPRLGLAFVARATGEYAEARRWLRSAHDLDPSSVPVREQLEAAEWDRPSRADISVGATDASGTTTSDWSLSAGVPVGGGVSVDARAGVLGGGDPIRGILFDSTHGGRVRATVVSAGAVLRLTAATLGLRADRWSSPNITSTFVTFFAGVPVANAFTLRAGGRTVTGPTSAPQVSIGADVRISAHAVLSVDGSQGVRDAVFDARTHVGVFGQLTPTVRETFRLGLLRDIDSRLGATTAVASGTHFFRPTLGVHLDLAVRTGAFARRSVGTGVTVRW